MALFPPVPGPGQTDTLSDREIRQLVDRTTQEVLLQTKKAQQDRFLIWIEDFGQLVKGKIRNTFEDSETIARINRFVTTRINLGKDIAKAVAVVYKHGARRVVQDASTEEQEAWSRWLRQLTFDARALEFNRLAFLCGPVLTVPTPRGGRMTIDRFVPHQYEVIQDDDDPIGRPRAAAWTVANPDPSKTNESITVVLDSEAWYFLNPQMRPARAPIVHGLGYFPGEVMRLDDPIDEWWSPTWNDRLREATVDAAFWETLLDWTRKSQNKKLYHAIGQITGIQQKLDPEYPVLLDGKGAAAADVGVDDFDTSPENFITHIRHVVDGIERAYGVRVHINSDASAIEVSIAHDRLNELRNEQTPFCRRWDHGFAAKASAMARRFRIRGWLELPSTDAVMESYAVEYPELDRTDDPLRKQQIEDWNLKRGLISHIDLAHRQRPELTRAQAKDWLFENIDEQAEVIARLTKRDQSLEPTDDAPDIETPAQQFGRRGPEVRDGNRPRDGEE